MPHTHPSNAVVTFAILSNDLRYRAVMLPHTIKTFTQIPSSASDGTMEYRAKNLYICSGMIGNVQQSCCVVM